MHLIRNKTRIYCSKMQKNQHGFTLIEIAVVLVLVGLLLGSFIGSLGQRIETTQRENTKKQIADIKIALLGFVSARGRLPCPTTTTGNGFEVPNGGSTNVTPCTLQHGFVPGKTLGIDGAYNLDNLLVDVWGNPIRYSVTANDNNAFTTPYTVPGAGGMADVGMAVLDPDLIICSRDSSSTTDCVTPPPPPPPAPPPPAIKKLIETAPFIILSLGKDGGNFVTNTAPNSDQGENSGEVAIAKNAAGEDLAYTVGSNRVFVSKSYSSADSNVGLFDDLILWESPYIIYTRMLEAGHVIEANPLP